MEIDDPHFFLKLIVDQRSAFLRMNREFNCNADRDIYRGNG